MTELENDGQNDGEPAEDASGAGVAVALVGAGARGLRRGGGGSCTPPPVQNPAPTAVPPPVVPPPPIQITDAEAARFLLQAQFAVTDADLAAVKANGYSAWLTASYNQPLGQTGVAWLDSRGHNSITVRTALLLAAVRRLHDLEPAARGSGPDAQAPGVRAVGILRGFA